MKSFLDHIIDKADLSNLRSTCYVFPTQRAGRHFENLIKKRFQDKVFWSPSVLSIQDFIEYLNPNYTIVSEIRLVTELFEVYKKQDPSIIFDEFYSWGQVLIKDFDEVDRYLVNPELLYKNMQDIKDVDQAFGPDVEALEAILDFQKVIDVSGNGKLFSEFDSTWKTVGNVYHQFKEALIQKGIAYDGMLYRKAASQVAEKDSYDFEKIVFAGFNALSLAEETIFGTLLKQDKAEVYFDTDRFYFGKQDNEASKFLKRYQHIWANEKVYWIDADGYSKKRTINIIGSLQAMAQAKIASNLIATNPNYKNGSTAIVLADEALLYPTLYALPDQGISINVTMGYPALSNSLGALIKSFFEYQASLKRKGDHIIIPQPVLLELYANSLLQDENATIIEWLRTTKKTNLSWLWLQEYKNTSAVAKLVTTPAKTPLQSLQAALDIIEYIHAKDFEVLKDAVVVKIFETLTQIKAELAQVKSAFDFKFVRKVVSEALTSLKIPFGKEVDTGLQVMGFLETRILDFDNLIILSANEGQLPASSHNKSFIPFGLRMAFKMPHFTEQDSIYAYHFYRLLQRATNVTLVYNTELSIDGSGEKSRYILQLLNHQNGQNSNLYFNEYNVFAPINHNLLNKREITVDKSEEVLNLINELFFTHAHDRPISPTLLLDYIECPLRFYFRRIKKLRKEDAITNEIDAREFGLIVHHTLHHLYEPNIGVGLSKNDILEIKKRKLRPQIDKEFESLLGLSTFVGKAEYQHYVIENILNRLLTKDAQAAPLKITGLELELNKSSFLLTLTINGKPIDLGGIIDRLDEIQVDGATLTRIIDYKTGKVETQKTTIRKQPIDLEVYVENYFFKPAYKAEFQSYFYALIYHRSHPQSNVTAGIFGLKEIEAGLHYVRGVAQAIPTKLFDLFEARLVKMIEEILNPSTPFCQTNDTDTCAYCEFKAMCGR